MAPQAAKRHALRRETARGRHLLRDNGIQIQTLEERIRLPRRRRQVLRPDAFVSQGLLDGPDGVLDVPANLGQTLRGHRSGQLLPDPFRQPHQPGDTESFHGLTCYRMKALLSMGTADERRWSVVLGHPLDVELRFARVQNSRGPQLFRPRIEYGVPRFTRSCALASCG